MKTTALKNQMAKRVSRSKATLTLVAASLRSRHGRAGSDAAISLEEGGTVPGTG